MFPREECGYTIGPSRGRVQESGRGRFGCAGSFDARSPHGRPGSSAPCCPMQARTHPPPPPPVREPTQEPEKTQWEQGGTYDMQRSGALNPAGPQGSARGSEPRRAAGHTEAHTASAPAGHRALMAPPTGQMPCGAQGQVGTWDRGVAGGPRPGSEKARDGGVYVPREGAPPSPRRGPRPPEIPEARPRSVVDRPVPLEKDSHTPR